MMFSQVRNPQSCLSLWIFLSLISTILAWPFAMNQSWPDSRYIHQANPIPSLSRRAGDFYLRTMPLGASITWGLYSSDNNGYRKALRNQLRYAGWKVNMVGSKRNGDMKDNNLEAHSGDVIDDVKAALENSIKDMPNLVLINAGTNDMEQSIDVANAHNRMGAILDRIFDAVPGVTIILSTLIPAQSSVITTNSVTYNANLRSDIASRRQSGQKIVLADMNTGFITLSDLTEGKHPNDGGYKKMAAVWWKAIQEADSAGFLTAPVDTGVDDSATGSDSTCDKTYGNGVGPIQTQRGSGTDDGIYVHKSEAQGVVLTFNSKDQLQGTWFANVLGSGFDDMIVYNIDGNGDVAFLVYQAKGSGKWELIGGTINPGNNCKARGVHWGDLNGDGLADYFCIGPEGNLYASINNGWSGASNDNPSFTNIGLVMTHPDGYSQENVRLGDIDGDGRIDYSVIGSNGDISTWRNGGQGLAPTDAYDGYWQSLGVVFTGKGKGDITGVRFVDLNGDGRDDWIWMADDGQVSTYINQRGCDKGLAPDWQDAGITHAGMGVAGARDHVYFARNWLQYGKHSYVYFTHEQNDDGFAYSVSVWKNVGAGGTYLKGDGDHYCDMRGSGSDDYVWISPNGQGTLYSNIHSPPAWSEDGVIFDLGIDRKALHLADMDGDGKCDIVQVIKDSGAINVWRNDYDAGSGKFIFTPLGSYGGAASCTQGWGQGLYDLGLRFADITGDGKADYLCMEPNGRTTGFLNNGQGNFESVGQIKYSEGKDRANHRWADVNGDGLADFLWIDKFNGDTYVWYNGGQIARSGSAFTWWGQGALYQGPAQGACMHFPNLGGLGRADFHEVIARTNLAYTWFNQCPNQGGDDSDTGTDPGLPTVPDSSTTTPGSGGSGSGSGDITTDGTCGVDHNNLLCGLWSSGSCCSAGGLCGTGDACGTGCQSGCSPLPESDGCSPGFSCEDTTGASDFYEKVYCTNPVITDAATAPADRWTQVYVEQAWTAAVSSWKAKPSPGGLSFPEQVSNFFHGPEGLNCGSTSDHNGCQTYSECDDTSEPAGYLILNSMVTLENIILNWYDAINRVQSNILAQVSDMVDDFAPVPKEPDGVKLAIDVIQLGYGLVAAGMWNSVLKGLAYFKANGNTLGVLKDSVNSMVSSGVTIVKELQESSDYELAEQNTISKNIGIVIDLWYSSIDEMNTNLFNGSDGSISDIHTLIEGGQLLENAYTAISDRDIQTMMEKSIFAMLLPGVWRLSQNGDYPAILDIDTACGDSVDFDSILGLWDIEDKAVNDWACVNNKIYYLLGAIGDSYSCDGGEDLAVDCENNNWSGLPGLGKLDGSVYGGITKEDLINGAINTYVANGNSNGLGVPASTLDDSSISSLLDLDVRAPGIINIPVCGIQKARDNWENNIDNKGSVSSIFPCN